MPSFPPTVPACVPDLSDGVVLLRAHRAADAPRIIEQCRDAATLRFTTVPRPYDDAAARDFLELVRRGWTEALGGDPRAVRHWAIARVDASDLFLGSIDLRPSGGGSADVGFGLHPDARGAGLMARAVRLLQAYAVRELAAHTLRWRALVGNWASRRVAWACGFSHEGTLRALLSQPTPDGTAVRDADAWAASWRAGEPTTPRRPWYVAPDLRADGLLLRAWQDGDGAALDAATDEAADRFMPGLVPTQTTYGDFLHHRRDREASGTGVAWAITTETSGELLGGIHLFDMAQPRHGGNGTVGVFVLARFRGRDVCARALRLVLDRAFAPVDAGGLGLARVRSDVDLADTASVRAMLRAGMTYVGWTRDARPDTRPGFAGERVDMCSLEALASDDRDQVAQQNRRAAAGPRTIRAHAVVLRPFRESDASAVARLMRDPDFGPEHLPSAGEADARRWIIRGLAGNYRGFTLRWAICPVDPHIVIGSPSPAPGEPVGYIRAFALDDRLYRGDARIGYTLHPSARRRGLATAAATALVGYLLTPQGRGGFGLRRVTAVAAPENVASHKVLQAAGLSRWFIDPQVLQAGIDGAISADLWRYGRIAEGLPPAGTA